MNGVWSFPLLSFYVSLSSFGVPRKTLPTMFSCFPWYMGLLLLPLDLMMLLDWTEQGQSLRSESAEAEFRQEISCRWIRRNSSLEPLIPPERGQMDAGMSFQHGSWMFRRTMNRLSIVHKNIVALGGRKRNNVVTLIVNKLPWYYTYACEGYLKKNWNIFLPNKLNGSDFTVISL